MFADLEARMNAAISSSLSNVEADIDGVLVPGIFRNAYAEEFGGLASGRSPVFACLESDVPELTQGAEVIIGDITYTAVSLEPDGAGWVTCLLRKG